MTPLEYVRDHINITSVRKLLYNCIFNKFKMEADEEDTGRKLLGSVRKCVHINSPLLNSQDIIRFSRTA